IYREILDVIQDHEPSLRALEAIVAAGTHAVAAASVLEPMYQQAGEWGKLARVHEVQIQHEVDVPRKVDLLHAMAEIFEFRLDDPRRAFEAYGRALGLDNTSERTLEALERIGEQLGAWQDIARLYDSEVEKLSEEQSEAGLVDMALRAAMIYEVQI